jgi:hypothetical protein
MNANNNDKDREGDQSKGSNKIKDPEDWTTGDEPMTGAQKSYLHTLAEGADEQIDDNMTKAQAAEMIEELQKSNGNKRNNSSASDSVDNTVKNPDNWKTGDEKMTGAQRSYLKTLSDQAGEELDENLTKAEASKRIDELQQKTGRGQ